MFDHTVLASCIHRLKDDQQCVRLLREQLVLQLFEPLDVAPQQRIGVFFAQVVRGVARVEVLAQ
jgi:hypothetical protein